MFLSVLRVPSYSFWLEKLLGSRYSTPPNQLPAPPHSAMTHETMLSKTASDMQAWKAAQTHRARQQYEKSKAHQRHLAALKKLEDQRKQREKTRRARKAAGDRKRADKAKKIAAKIAMKAMKAMGAAEE